MNKIKIKKTLAVFGLSVLATGMIAVPAFATGEDETVKVTFCHATTAIGNPYVEITTDPTSILEMGHLGHLGPVFNGLTPGWGDIIPAFEGFVGVNVEGGSEILSNGCRIVASEETPTPTTDPTADPTTDPTVEPTVGPTETPDETFVSSPAVTPDVSVARSSELPRTGAYTYALLFYGILFTVLGSGLVFGSRKIV